MARVPRNKQIAEDEVGLYHIFSRTVRRAFLFGEDAVTGQSFNHRLDLLHTGCRTLARIFTIDVLCFAFMQNHFHQILRNRPDLASKLSNQSIALRMCLLNEIGLSPELKSKERTRPQQKKLLDKANKLLHDKERLRQARAALSSISVYQQRLKKMIAWIANKEDDVSGHFWADRFKSIAIDDERQLLTTMVYVDLNAVRAGIVRSPEESRYTSAYQRIHALRARLQFDPENGVQEQEAVDQTQVNTFDAIAGDVAMRRVLDSWLSPIDCRREGKSPDELDEMEPLLEDAGEWWTAVLKLHDGELIAEDTADLATKSNEDGASPSAESGDAAVSCDEELVDLPLLSSLPARASNSGCLEMSLIDYLKILDWVGRESHADKPGAIPDDMPPLLERIGIGAPNEWLTQVAKYDGRVKGAFSAPVNRVAEAARCLVQTPDGPRALPEAAL